MRAKKMETRRPRTTEFRAFQRDAVEILGAFEEKCFMCQGLTIR